jgi:MFS family permease
VTGLGARFWRLYASSAVSNLADGIGRTALPLLATHYTRNPVAISGLASLAFLPWLLFALPSGALVDRVDRRYAMAAANCVRAAATALLGILVLVHAAGIAVLYGVAFALGAAETVYDSATRAILPQVVDGDRLDSANSLLTVEETLGQALLGATVGSALFAFAVGLPFLVNGGGFTVAALLILLLRGNYRPKRSASGTSIRHDVAEGVRWLARHRFLRELTLISTTTAFLSSMAFAVLVLYVLETLHLPSGDFGGVGAIAGGLATTPLARWFGRGRVLVVGSVITAAGMTAMGLTHNGFVATALFAVSEAGVMTWNVLTMSLRQALIPPELFGRVQGAYRTLVWGAFPLGSLTGGVVANRFGIQTPFVIGGAGMLAMAGVLAVVVRAHADQLDAAPTDTGSVTAGTDSAVCERAAVPR